MMSLYQIHLRLSSSSHRETYWVMASTAKNALDKAYKAFDHDTRSFADDSDNMLLVSMERQEGKVLR